MRKQRIAYFIIGLVLQLAIFSVIAYWFTLVSTESLEAAISEFSSKLPSFLRDTTVVMVITAAFVVLSMICYSVSRNYSLSRSFRSLTMGLILLDAIVLLWIILALM